MGNRWRHWRNYLDRVEELMRLSGELLDEESCELLERQPREALPDEARWRELARRGLTMPFFDQLLEAAAGVGPDDLAEPLDREFLQPWDAVAARPTAAEPEPDRRTEHREPRSHRPDPASAPPRLRNAERVLAERTRSLTVVLDELGNPLNASAVVRSCEALGLQEMHFSHARGRMVLSSGIHKHCEKWLDLHWHRSPEVAVSHLRSRGFTLLAADRTEDSLPIERAPLDAPLALVFGNEQSGVSAEFRQRVDGFFHLPMVGFTSYINVSNAVALGVAAFDRRLREAGLRASLSEQEKSSLRRKWYDALARTPERRREYREWLASPPRPSTGERARRHGER